MSSSMKEPEVGSTTTSTERFIIILIGVFIVGWGIGSVIGVAGETGGIGVAGAAAAIGGVSDFGVTVGSLRVS